MPRSPDSRGSSLYFSRFWSSWATNYAARLGCNSQATPHLRHDLLGQNLQLVECEAVRHPRPMHRGDDVVDPEAAVQSDHLVGHLGGRPEQETVLQELIEAVVEIVALGHDLVLPPGTVGLVFLFEIGLRTA